MLGIVIVIVGYFLLGWIVRAMADREILWCFVPANTTGYIVQRGSTLEPKGVGSKATPAAGGNIVKVIHAVPGMKIMMNSHDNRQWQFVPGYEVRGLFYYLFGVQYIGIFRELRTNKVREFRFSIDDKEVEKAEKRIEGAADKASEPAYHVHSKSYDTKFVYYSREHAVHVLKAETKSFFALELLFNILYKETFPVRARLEVADSNAILTTLIDRTASSITKTEEANYFLTGPKEHTYELEEAVCTEVSQKALEMLGITVTKAILDSIDPDEKTRKLLERQKEQEIIGKADAERQKQEIETAKHIAQQAIERAEGEKQAQIKRNDADADRITRVYQPLAANESLVRLRTAEVRAEAYAANKTITHYTYVEGNDKVTPVLPLTQQ